MAEIPLNPKQIDAYYGLNIESDYESNDDNDVMDKNDNNNNNVITLIENKNASIELRRSARIKEKKARLQNLDTSLSLALHQDKQQKNNRQQFIKDNTFSVSRNSADEKKTFKQNTSCHLKNVRSTPTLEVIKEEGDYIERGRRKKRILSKSELKESISIDGSDCESKSRSRRRRRQYSFYEKLNSSFANNNAGVLHIENPEIKKPNVNKNNNLLNNGSIRRSTRTKVKTLDSSVNQRPIYKFSNEGPFLVAVTDVTIKRSDRKKYAHYAKFVTEFVE